MTCQFLTFSQNWIVCLILLTYSPCKVLQCPNNDLPFLGQPRNAE